MDVIVAVRESRGTHYLTLPRVHAGVATAAARP